MNGPLESRAGYHFSLTSEKWWYVNLPRLIPRSLMISDEPSSCRTSREDCNHYAPPIFGTISPKQIDFLTADWVSVFFSRQKSDLGGRIMISGSGNFKRYYVWLIQRDNIVFNCEDGQGGIHFAISYWLDNACAGIWRRCRVRDADKPAA